MKNIDYILQHIDLVDLVRQAGANPTRSGNEWRCNCPIHGGDNPTAFVIYDKGDRQHWYCFTRAECGGGDAIDFVMRYYHLDFAEACRFLAGDSQVDAAAAAEAATRQAQRAERALQEQIEVAQRALADLQAAQAWLRYHDSLAQNQEARQLWRQRGVPDDYQNWWHLGYCPRYTLHTPQGNWFTPTLTIPIYTTGWEVRNVRHRLLNPYRPGDKYRPERAGLPALAFLADPDVGYSAERILVVEGEIKAMVAFLTADWPGLQVVGIPGKNSFASILESLRDRAVWLCLDPDAQKEAADLAKAINGRIVYLPIKIDDAILAGVLTKTGLRRLIESAKK